MHPGSCSIYTTGTDRNIELRTLEIHRHPCDVRADKIEIFGFTLGSSRRDYLLDTTELSLRHALE